MKISQAGVLDITDAEGSLLNRPIEMLTAGEAGMVRAAAKLLRKRRFRMTVRCDACFEAGRGDGMRGEINPTSIRLECRCRHLHFDGVSL